MLLRVGISKRLSRKLMIWVEALWQFFRERLVDYHIRILFFNFNQCCLTWIRCLLFYVTYFRSARIPQIDWMALRYQHISRHTCNNFIIWWLVWYQFAQMMWKNCRLWESKLWWRAYPCLVWGLLILSRYPHASVEGRLESITLRIWSQPWIFQSS